MNCAEIQIDLSAFVDGELTTSRCAAVEQHLAVCPDCRRRVAELRQLALGVAGLPRLESPPSFLSEVHRKIRAREERSSWADALFRPVWWKVPLEALAVMAVVSVIVLWTRPPSLNQRTEIALTKLEQKRTLAFAKDDSAPPATRAKALPARETEVVGASKPISVSSPVLMAPSAKLAQGLAERPTQQVKETIVVEDADAEAVGKRVEVAAVQLRGRMVRQDQRAGALQNFQVELPVSNVGAFRGQFAVAERQRGEVAGQKVGAENSSAALQPARPVQTQTQTQTQTQSEAKGTADAVEATAVIEIQVVPPNR